MENYPKDETPMGGKEISCAFFTKANAGAKR